MVAETQGRSFIGLCNTNIRDCIAMLNEISDRPVYTIIDVEDVKKLNYFSVPSGTLLFASMQVFSQFFSYVYSLLTHDIIVFAPAVLLEYLQSINMVDADYQPNTFKYMYKKLTVDMLKTALDTKTSDILVQKPITLLPTLLKNEPGTITTPILNFLYTIQPAEDRKQVSDYVFNWLYSNESVDDLEEALTDACRLNVRKNRHEAFLKLREFIESDLGVGIRSALREAKKQGLSGTNVEVNSLSKKYGVTTYDLKYIIKSFSDVTINEDDL